MSTVAISKNSAMTRNQKATLLERFKKYVLDNAEYFAASSAMLTGNSSAVVQIMKDSKRHAARN